MAALDQLVVLAILLQSHVAIPNSHLSSKHSPPPLPSFDVVWNSDFSLHCQALNATLRLEQNGIRANSGQKWFGRAIATLYGAGATMPSAAGLNDDTQDATTKKV